MILKGRRAIDGLGFSHVILKVFVIWYGTAPRRDMLMGSGGVLRQRKSKHLVCQGG